MAQPTSGQVHIDVPLTNISVAYVQDQNNFIASKVFPDLNVAKQSNKYFVFDRNAFMRDHMQKRAAGEESAGSGYALSNDSYFCDVWALHKDISDFDRTNTDSPLDADRNAVTFLTQQALIRKERQWASDFFTTGVWTTDKTVTNQWSDYVNSDPLGDVDEGKEQILTDTGMLPNTLVLSYKVFNKLKNHPDIVDRIKYTSSRVVTEDVLASLFGVSRILVPKAIADTTAEGKAAAPALIHGKHALLCYVAPSPGLEAVSAGYTFNWTGFAAGFSGMGVAVEKLRMDHLKSDRIESHMAFDQKKVSAQCGYFFGSVIA
jgi:hypothetical protein